MTVVVTPAILYSSKPGVGVIGLQMLALVAGENMRYFTPSRGCSHLATILSWGRWSNWSYCILQRYRTFPIDLLSRRLHIDWFLQGDWQCLCPPNCYLRKQKSQLQQDEELPQTLTWNGEVENIGCDYSSGWQATIVPDLVRSDLNSRCHCSPWIRGAGKRRQLCPLRIYL